MANNALLPQVGFVRLTSIIGPGRPIDTLAAVPRPVEVPSPVVTLPVSPVAVTVDVRRNSALRVVDERTDVWIEPVSACSGMRSSPSRSLDAP